METNSYDNDSNNITNTLFDLLCDEILVMIMSFSDLSIIDKYNVIKASERQHISIDNSSLNRKTLMQTSHQTISSNDLALIISKCLNVSHIDLSHIRVYDQRVVSDAAHDYSDNSSVVIMSAIAHNSHHLESIHFGLLAVNNAQFEAILTNCSQLKRIASKTINDDTLRHIIESPNLEALDLSGNTKISGAVLTKLGPNITELNLNTSLIDLKPLIKTMFDEIEKLRTFLRTSLPVVRNIDNAFGLRVISWLTDLRQINEDMYLGQRCRDMFIQKSYTIRKLSVCITSNDELKNIVLSFKRINHISLNVTCSECDLWPLRELRSLSSVSISANHFDDLMRVLRSGVKHVEVTDGSESNCRDITFNDRSLQLLPICTPFLNELVLRQFNSITDEGMTSIAKLTHLIHLDLMNCENVGNGGIVWVIRSCNRLRVLNLHNCVRIGPSVLKSVIFHCYTIPHEKFTLDVVNTGITKVDSSIALPSNLNLLVNIDQCVYDCWHI